MKKILGFAVVALMTTAYPMASHATCSKFGTIVDVFEWDDSQGSMTHGVLMREGSLSSTLWRADTTDDNMAGFAATALASQAQVFVLGGAASCPTTGSTRFMGQLHVIEYY